VLEAAGLRTPAQQPSASIEDDLAFLERHGRIVVKPALGEQGAGVSVDVRDEAGLRSALQRAERNGGHVVLEQLVDGQDLRVVVIDGTVVAAAVRRPPAIVGDDRLTVRELVEKQSRRRAAATGGESRIPIDDECQRCLRDQGRGLDEVLPAGSEVVVRRAANLHAGGTIHDVTARLSPAIADAAVAAARALEIPVVGLDFITPDPESGEWWLIEANERPGLANHEPQPTAQAYVDLLFPNTASSRGG
jgi:GNAT-family acetyltransferase (TIGR03103 family)